MFYEIISNYKFVLSWSHSFEIDKLGLRVSTDKAIIQLCDMCENIEEVLLDGNYVPKSNYNIKSLVKGDKNNLMISYASIIAKEVRDNYMRRIAEIYPQYMWNSNVGYGTKAHIEAIKKYGVTKFHRLSYKPLSIYSNIL